MDGFYIKICFLEDKFKVQTLTFGLIFMVVSYWIRCRLVSKDFQQYLKLGTLSFFKSICHM